MIGQFKEGGSLKKAPRFFSATVKSVLSPLGIAGTGLIPLDLNPTRILSLLAEVVFGPFTG